MFGNGERSKMMLHTPKASPPERSKQQVFELCNEMAAPAARTVLERWGKETDFCYPQEKVYGVPRVLWRVILKVFTSHEEGLHGHKAQSQSCSSRLPVH